MGNVFSNIRNYAEEDAQQVGWLIADTYAEFNLAFAPDSLQRKMLGPFQFAASDRSEHKQAIIDILRSPIILVAESDGNVVGVLRGRKERLASLFVRKDFHNQGVGRDLVARFEQEMTSLGVKVILVAATLYAVPFYAKLGYKKSTGVRITWSFDGYGFPVQPMKKVFGNVQKKL